jgi:hypothetical protein
MVPPKITEDVMKKALWMALALGALAPVAGAAALQDWAKLETGVNVGTYADKAGSKIEVLQVDGPAKGEKAVRLSSKIVQWGGMWAAAAPGLDKAAGIRFKAKASAPGLLLVSLSDDRKVQVEARVRVRDGGWQDFELPLSAFVKASWQDPEAPKGAVFNPAKLASFNLSSRSVGESEYSVGPISLVEGKAVAKTGLASDGKAGTLVMQDFETLEASAYGPFVDEKVGSKISVSLKEEAGKKGNKVAVLDYDLKPAGWCGAWMRAGDDWTGQDWNGAKSVELRVYSKEPLQLELAFNDANQNAYLSTGGATTGKGWETLKVPFSSFVLNPYYQPPQAKKGAALDLSHVETFNVAPKTEGKHSFQVDDILLQK